MDTVSFTLLEFFRMGGIIMWPLLVFSIAAIAISLERIVYLIYHNLQTEDLRERVSELLKKQDYFEAVSFLSSLTKRRMAARIFLALLNRAHPEKGFSEQQAERAAEIEALNCINTLENGFTYLVAIGSIAPLLGFLGTVTGMIGAFRSIAEATEVNAQIVASGIYEALITTVFGLIIAIIAMFFHSIFSYIVDKFASRIEGSCSQLIAQISDQKET